MLTRLLLLGLILAGISPAAAQEPFPALVVNAVARWLVWRVSSNAGRTP